MPGSQRSPALAERLEALADGFPGRVGYVIRNLRTGDAVTRAEHELFPTASVIKLPLLSVFSACVERGTASWEEHATVAERDLVGGSGLLRHLAVPHTLSYGDAAWYALCLSDNVATNLFIERLGGVASVNGLLRRHVGHDLHLHSLAMGRRDAGARSMGEATPAAVADVLVRLVEGTAPGARRLLDITAQQLYRTMIPRYLPAPGPASGVRRICNKTGFLDGIRADAAVIETETGAVVMAAFTDRASPAGTHEDPGERLIAGLAARAYQAWFGASPPSHGHEGASPP